MFIIRFPLREWLKNAVSMVFMGQCYDRDRPTISTMSGITFTTKQMLKELLAMLLMEASAISPYEANFGDIWYYSRLSLSQLNLIILLFMIFGCPVIRLFSKKMSNQTCFNIVCPQNNIFWYQQFSSLYFLRHSLWSKQDLVCIGMNV